MRFLDLKLYEKLLIPIPLIRPLLKIQLPELDAEKKLDQLDLSMPHHVFTVSLKEIDKEISVPGHPTGVRIIELDAGNPVAIYDLSPNENRPEVLQVSTDKAYLKNIENGIEQLKRAEAGDENELRLLRFPALNLEALWLAGDDGKNDKFYLVRHFEDREGVLDQKEFNALVQRLKAAAEQQDDTMGA